MQRGERECFMRIAVFSDSHGVKEPMLAAIEEQKPDMVLHLGDYVRDAEAIAAYFPSLDLRYVRGNCDAEVDQMVLEFPIEADSLALFLGGRMAFVTHGHLFNTANPPKLCPGDLLIHGHTHVQAMDPFGQDNLYLNPGSVSLPKEGNENSYMTYEDGLFTIKAMDGRPIRSTRI